MNDFPCFSPLILGAVASLSMQNTEFCMFLLHITSITLYMCMAKKTAKNLPRRVLCC